MAIQVVYQPKKQSILGNLLGTAANALTFGLVNNAVGKTLGGLAGNTAGQVASNATATTLGNGGNTGSTYGVTGISQRPASYLLPNIQTNTVQNATPQQNSILTNLKF